MFTVVEQKTCKKSVSVALDEAGEVSCGREDPDSYTCTTDTPCPPPGTVPQLGPPYLAVQLPGSVVFLGTPSVENGLVVHLDQLPFGAVAEVSKHATRFVMRKIIPIRAMPVASLCWGLPRAY